MKRRQLTLIFGHFEQEHLGKDVFLVPYYLGKALDYDVTIVYPRTETNCGFPSSVRGVKLKPLNPGKAAKALLGGKLTEYALTVYPYLIKKARSIDTLVLFHALDHTYEMAWIYKKLNPKGQLYLKLDGVYKPLEWIKPSTSYFGNLQYKMASNLCNYVDCVSIETSQDLKTIQDSKLPQLDFGDKLVLMPNGFDEESFAELNVKVKSHDEKEDLIVTVGRLGTEQKNTEMLLDALDGIDLKGWKVMLVGSIEPELESKINEFYSNNPDKKDSVLFTGAIYDKAKLFDIYNRAKVFVLTSRWESSALVLVEAFRFNDYLVSTKVGAAEDMIQSGRYGTFVNDEDAMGLKDIINGIVSRRINTDVFNDNDYDKISWHTLIENVARKLRK